MNNKETFMQKTVVVWFGALICCALWGSAFPCIKIGYELFSIPSDSVASQILFAGYRFTLAGMLAILFGSVLSRKLLFPKKNSWIKIGKLSMLQTVAQYLFFYVGLAHTSGVKASIIEGVNVFIAILVASLIFKQERLNAQKLVGCIIGFAGVVIINLTGNGLDMNMSFLGEGFIFFSTVAYAFSSVYLKRYSQEENPVVLSGYQFVFGGVVMIVCGLAAGGEVHGFTMQSMGMLIYLAFISAMAYSLWGILLQYNPISRVAVFGFMNPVFGVILSALLLGEGSQAAGMKSVVALILVCAGIYIVNYVKNENTRS
ncbi:MAG: DMT family transporter [Lachnospiraceae bacterium]|nr:DMT family transporter [Lachnospiraceae bacterium]MDD3615782.1 DMT family transporter [Lachnospiraceae bacterium]